jgi:hypothetical protein
MPIRRFAAPAVLMLVMVVLPAQALAGFGSLSLVTANGSGAAANGGSSPTSTSTAGHTAAFSSDAPDLVPGDLNGDGDVFVRDLQTGVTSLVSRSTGGVSQTANAESFDPMVSDDGRYVAFTSKATNLVPGQADTNAGFDIFLHDNATGTTALVSHTSAGQATAGDHQADTPSISADGRFVTFRTDSQLISGQTGSTFGNYYIYDRDDGSLRLINHVAGNETQGAVSGFSSAPVISAAGNWVAFSSGASDIVGSTGTSGKVFLYNVATRQNTLVDHRVGAGTDASDGDSQLGAVSADGRFVAYVSSSTNLVAGQDDAADDPPGPDPPINDGFLFDRATGNSVLMTHVPGNPLKATDNVMNFQAAIARDGSRVGYTSEATNLVAGQTDTNGAADAFLYDRGSGVNQLLSHVPGNAAATASASSDAPLAISMSARYVGFSSSAGNIVAGEVKANAPIDRDAFVFDTTTGQTVLVSHALGSSTRTGNSGTGAAAFVGETLLLDSRASDVVVADANGNEDVYAASNLAPAPAFTATPPSGNAPLGVSFTATGGDPDGSVASYAWDFGDGATASGVSAQHTFLFPGTYAARLAETDDTGATASTQQTITVGKRTPPTISALVNALLRRVAGPCHRKIKSNVAVLACGGNRRGKPSLRLYLVNARASALTLKVSAQEALPRNAAALARVRYKTRKIRVAPRSTRRVTFKAPRKLQRALIRALRRHRSITRRPRITFSAAGVRKTAFTHRIVVRRPKHSR